MNVVWLLCRLGCNEPAYTCGGGGAVEDASAAQNVRAGLCPAAEMVLASCVLNIQRQLACGNRSRAENGCHHRRKQCVLGYIPGHDSFSFSVISFMWDLHGCLFPLRRKPGRTRRAKCGGGRSKGAEATVRARLDGAASAAAGKAPGLAPKLPGGNCPRAKDSNDDGPE